MHNEIPVGGGKVQGTTISGLPNNKFIDILPCGHVVDVSNIRQQNDFVKGALQFRPETVGASLRYHQQEPIASSRWIRTDKIWRCVVQIRNDIGSFIPCLDFWRTRSWTSHGSFSSAAAIT